MEIITADKNSSPEERQRIFTMAETLHRQLRPRIPPPYASYMNQMLEEGASLCILRDENATRALAVWRFHHTTFRGLRFYVDDLVTDEARRGSGHGGQLLDWLEQRARELGCDAFDLDSGVHRAAAHRFYFRHRLTVASFGFTKPLTDRFS